MSVGMARAEDAGERLEEQVWRPGSNRCSVPSHLCALGWLLGVSELQLCISKVGVVEVPPAWHIWKILEASGSKALSTRLTHGECAEGVGCCGCDSDWDGDRHSLWLWQCSVNSHTRHGVWLWSGGDPPEGLTPQEPHSTPELRLQSCLCHPKLLKPCPCWHPADSSQGERRVSHSLQSRDPDSHPGGARVAVRPLSVVFVSLLPRLTAGTSCHPWTGPAGQYFP